MRRGIKKIIKYENKKFKDKLIVNLFITSFNKNIKKPTAIAKNNTLKKFSFL